jgi:hypothetical protein
MVRLHPSSPEAEVSIYSTEFDFANTVLAYNFFRFVSGSLIAYIMSFAVKSRSSSEVFSSGSGIKCEVICYEITSWNCGVEGPTDDLETNRLRERQRRRLSHNNRDGILGAE